MASMLRYFLVVLTFAFASLSVVEADAQPPRKNRRPPWYIEPTPETLRKVEQLMGKVHDVEITVRVQPNISRLIRTKQPIHRISITDPTVLDVIMYSPTEFELIGRRRGVTSMTIWYGNQTLRLAE